MSTVRRFSTFVTLFCILIVAFAALPVSAATPDDPGVIAYVQRSTANIRLISPDGSGDRLLWTAPPSENKTPAIDLAWRPDGRELAFTSTHENACSWYDSDIFAIGSNGAGYRRITNSPACAVLATLPQGAVTVNVDNWTSTPIWVYVAGAPSVKWVSGSGTVLFDKVADFGPGIHQPSIGIYGLRRFVSYPPYADVEPGKTLPGGNITVSSDSGFTGFGAGKVSWKADGAALGYNMRSCTAIDGIPAVPPNYGFQANTLPVVAQATPCSMVWNPALAGKDQYVYYSSDVTSDEAHGIFLYPDPANPGGHKLLLHPPWHYSHLNDMEWLPDGSGFLYNESYFNFGTETCGGISFGQCSNIFQYDLATDHITQLTDFSDNLARAFTVSPDGQQIVFERWTNPDIDEGSSLWIINRDGTGLHMLVDNAGRPAWGRTASAPPPPAKVYLPVLVR